MASAIAGRNPPPLPWYSGHGNSELATTVTEMAAVCNTFSPRGPASPYGTAELLSHTAKIYSPQKWQAFVDTSCCVLWI